MKTKKLVELCSIYYEIRPMPKPTDRDRAAILFGTDDVKLDYRRNKVRLPDIGWVDAQGLQGAKHAIEWIAVLEEGDAWVVLAGAGSPYDGTNPVLPRKDGVILAMPAVMAGDVAAAPLA